MARVGPQRHRKKKLLTAFGLTLGGSGTVRIYKQCTEQHNEIEYPEQNIHNNKNT